MNERFYDLNGREGCVTAEIRVSDKTFRISRVVTGVRVCYANQLRMTGEMLREVSKADTSTEEGIRAVKDLTARVDKFAEEKKRAYDEILSLLLERNGYTYDHAWWEENTDEFDIRAFIEACLSKDADGQGQKKK